MDSHRMDAESLLAHMNYKKAELQRKREWLMGYHSYSSFIKEESRNKEQLLLPESSIREDDLFCDVAERHIYSHIRGRINDALGSSSYSCEEFFDHSANLRRTVLAYLDNLTNNGLYLLAKFIKGNVVSFETTRVEMKRVIKNYLSKTHKNDGNGACISDVQVLHRFCRLMKDPQNVRQSLTKFVNPTWESHRDSIVRILDGLKDMPSNTISAMHRKLTGISKYVPRFENSRKRKKEPTMIVKKKCLKMLSELGDSDVLQKPLAKAMAIAELSLRLRTGCVGSSVTRFHDFPPEIDALHNEILKAIWMLKNLKKPELQRLKSVLDPEVELPDKGLKAAIRNLLVEYLFECSDMDTIPDSLFDALALISKSKWGMARKSFSSDVVEGDVESMHCLSADMKQILWDCMPDCEFDQEFADAYMEDLEDSDDGDLFDDIDARGTRGHEMDSDCVMENVSSNRFPHSGSFSSSAATSRDTVSHSYSTPTNSSKARGVKLEPEDTSSTELQNYSSSSIVPSRAEVMPSKQTARRNNYLAIQKVCDDASLIAYDAIGRVLKGFAETGNFSLHPDDWTYLGGKDANEKS
ncbi:hypothetical protein Droror1_Dr00001131 [Drosera rotundifolia]